MSLSGCFASLHFLLPLGIVSSFCQSGWILDLFFAVRPSNRCENFAQFALLKFHLGGTYFDRRFMFLQWNAEGVWGKKEALKHRLHEQKIDVACLQETHLKNSHRFSIRGYQTFRKDRESGPKGGILILVKNDLPAIELDVEPGDQAEIQCIKIKDKREITLFNCYCPPGKQLNLDKMAIPPERCIVLGDFNSHSPSWGYPDLDLRGEEIENWQIENRLLLLNHPDDQPTFYSRRWRSTTTPDLGFSTDDIEKSTSRTVLDQLAGSDHRPILIRMQLTKNKNHNYVITPLAFLVFTNGFLAHHV